MTPKQVLQRARGERLTDVRGDPVDLQLAPGLSRDELLALEQKLEAPLPPAIRELLEYSRGFTLRSKWFSKYFFEGGPDEGGQHALLSGRGWTGYPGWEGSAPDGGPRGLEILADICGNPWVVDVDSRGEWGAVFYISHDPPEIAFQSNDLASFLLEFFLFFTQRHESKLIDPRNARIERVPLQKTQALRDGSDPILRKFAATLNEDDLIADLRAKRSGTGFPWDLFGLDTEVRRFGTELAFALIKPQRKGLLRELLGK